MDDRAIIDALRAIEVPDEGTARLRARRLVLAAPIPPRRTPRRRMTALAVAALIVAAVSTAAAAQGPSAVARWVGTELGIRHTAAIPPHAASALSQLPGGGRLLVNAGRDAWIVGEGPPRRVANAGGGVAWSAYGHYLVQARGRQLQALDLHGRVLWTERHSAAVRDPVWSPDGNRIAFFVNDRLWVTAADGTAARPLSAMAGPLTPSWRPGSGHVLAILAAPGRIMLIDTDSRSLIAELRIGLDPVALSWSADGSRLLAAATRSARVYDGHARLIRIWRPSGQGQIAKAEISPSGAQFAALLRTSQLQSDAVLVPTAATRAARVLLSGGALGDLFFSPDGRWILVGWHELDSWFFFPTAGADPRVIQRTNIARALARGEPVVSGWCCRS